MATTNHASQTGADLHEPKGVASAADNTIAQASSNSIVWSADIAPDSLVLADTVYTNKEVPAMCMKLGGTNDPDFSVVSGSIKGYFFDAAADEELFFSLHFPNTYKAGEDITPYIRWSPSSTNTGNVRWGLEYSVIEKDGTFPSSTTLYAADAGSGTADDHLSINFSDIDGSSLDESAYIIGRVFRDADNVADTFTGDACLLSIGFSFKSEKIGTSNQFS